MDIQSGTTWANPPLTPDAPPDVPHEKVKVVSGASTFKCGPEILDEQVKGANYRSQHECDPLVPDTHDFFSRLTPPPRHLTLDDLPDVPHVLVNISAGDCSSNHAPKYAGEQVKGELSL